MIRLFPSPSDEAITRLHRCAERHREHESRGEIVPKGTLNGFRRAEVKSSIIQDTSGKCAYCESQIGHVYWGDVEHILPKSRFPELRYEYSNLTLACAICNNNKQDYFDAVAPILHPYENIPEDHLVGLGPFVWHRNASLTGRRTIELLDLNRNGLWERRKELLDRIGPVADRYVLEPAGPIKNVLRNELRDLMAPTAEYALVARSLLFSVYGIIWTDL
jgi:5-methylcytosine-specific restriction endonuclease McrA